MPNIKFGMSDEARQHNSEQLKLHNFELEKLLTSNEGTTMGFISEFRPMSQLEPLVLGQHLNFAAIKEFITNGMPFIFSETLNADTKALEIQATLDRGNHKSAESEAERLLKLISKDVKHGFSLHITKQAAHQIKGRAAQQPLGLVSQWTLSPDGSRILKDRMTQDLSFVVLNLSTRSTIESTWKPTPRWCMAGAYP
jgi:hypothetical protein